MSTALFPVYLPTQGPQQIILITGRVWYIMDQLKFHLYLNSMLPGECVQRRYAIRVIIPGMPGPGIRVQTSYTRFHIYEKER